jgi:hypothetical protein
MNNREKYNQMVVKRFKTERKKNAQTKKVWFSFGYHIPYIAYGYVAGTFIGAGLAFYVLYKYVYPFLAAIATGFMEGFKAGVR